MTQEPGFHVVLRGLEDNTAWFRGLSLLDCHNPQYLGQFLGIIHYHRPTRVFFETFSSFFPALGGVHFDPGGMDRNPRCFAIGPRQTLAATFGCRLNWVIRWYPMNIAHTTNAMNMGDHGSHMLPQFGSTLSGISQSAWIMLPKSDSRWVWPK